MTHQTLKGLEQEGLSPGLLKRIELSKGKYWSSLDEILNSVDATSETGNTDALRELLRKHVLGEPQVLQDDEYGKIWFQQDFRFETPKAHLSFRINTPQVYSSPRNAVLSQLYTDAISEGLNEFGYPAVSYTHLTLPTKA